MGLAMLPASLRSWLNKLTVPSAELIGEALAKLQRPLAHGLVTDHDAARGQKLIHHAQVEREAEVQLNGMADDLGREAVAGVAGAGGRRHPVRLLSSPPSHKPASSQVDGALVDASIAAKPERRASDAHLAELGQRARQLTFPTHKETGAKKFA